MPLLFLHAPLDFFGFQKNIARVFGQFFPIHTQAVVDLLAVGADSLDFIEFKKKDTGLSGTEREIKRLIEQKKVNYLVKDVELPIGVCVSERVLKPSRIVTSNLTEAR